MAFSNIIIPLALIKPRQFVVGSANDLLQRSEFVAIILKFKEHDLQFIMIEARHLTPSYLVILNFVHSLIESFKITIFISCLQAFSFSNF